MVSARCFIGMGRHFTFPASAQEMQSMLELEEKGIVCRPQGFEQQDCDQWFLTTKAATILETHMCLESPRLVFIGRPGIADDQMTALELYQSLKGLGFSLQEGDVKFKGKAYTGQRGSRKILTTLQRDSLLAFYRSQKLFSHGCEGIYHFQLAAYYIALVRVPNKSVPKVVPGKSANFYRSLWDDSFQDPAAKG